MIGGTGLSSMPGFEPVATVNPETPWGHASSPILIARHNGVPVAFLARHGVHHQFAPHEVNSRANIAALRHIGVRSIIAFSAVGSLREEIKPMDFVVPDQIIDRTKSARPFTFFEGGLVGHVGFADPFDQRLANVVKLCAASMEGEGVVLHEKGTVIVMGEFSHGRCSHFSGPSTPGIVVTHRLMNLQRAPNSRPGQSPTCTVALAAPSSTCRRSPSPSSPARPRSRTR